MDESRDSTPVKENAHKKTKTGNETTCKRKPYKSDDDISLSCSPEKYTPKVLAVKTKATKCADSKKLKERPQLCIMSRKHHHQREKRRKSRAERNNKRNRDLHQHQVNSYERSEFRRHVKKAKEISSHSHVEKVIQSARPVSAITHSRLTRPIGIYGKGKQSEKIYRGLDGIYISDRVKKDVDKSLKEILGSSPVPDTTPYPGSWSQVPFGSATRNPSTVTPVPSQLTKDPPYEEIADNMTTTLDVKMTFPSRDYFREVQDNLLNQLKPKRTSAGGDNQHASHDSPSTSGVAVLLARNQEWRNQQSAFSLETSEILDDSSPHNARSHSVSSMGPHPSGPHPSGPRPSQSHTARPHSARSYTSRSHATGSHATGSHATGSHATGSHATGSHATGSHATGSHPSGSHPSGSHPSGTHSSGTLPSHYHGNGYSLPHDHLDSHPGSHPRSRPEPHPEPHPADAMYSLSQESDGVDLRHLLPHELSQFDSDMPPRIHETARLIEEKTKALDFITDGLELLKRAEELRDLRKRLADEIRANQCRISQEDLRSSHHHKEYRKRHSSRDILDTIASSHYHQHELSPHESVSYVASHPKSRTYDYYPTPSILENCSSANARCCYHDDLSWVGESHRPIPGELCFHSDRRARDYLSHEKDCSCHQCNNHLIRENISDTDLPVWLPHFVSSPHRPTMESPSPPAYYPRRMY